MDETTWPPGPLRRVRAGDWDTSFLELGDPAGPVAVLLHGFPDSPSTWRHLAPGLAEDGWRVVVPWLPHYGPTRPAVTRPGVHPRDLAAWVVALAGALGADGRAVLVGHDWGAIATHQVTSTTPGAFSRAVSLAIPPMLTERLLPLPDLKQAMNSWYALAFQAPLANRFATTLDWKLVEKLWRDWSPGWEQGDVDRQGWRDALAHDRARGAISYYAPMLRTLLSGRWPREGEQRPQVPTLHLAGADDGCYRAERQQVDLPAVEVEVMEGVGHFLHLERPDEVGARVRAWLLDG